MIVRKTNPKKLTEVKARKTESKKSTGTKDEKAESKKSTKTKKTKDKKTESKKSKDEMSGSKKSTKTEDEKTKTKKSVKTKDDKAESKKSAKTKEKKAKSEKTEDEKAKSKKSAKTKVEKAKSKKSKKTKEIKARKDDFKKRKEKEEFIEYEAPKKRNRNIFTKNGNLGFHEWLASYYAESVDIDTHSWYDAKVIYNSFPEKPLNNVTYPAIAKGQLYSIKIRLDFTSQQVDTLKRFYRAAEQTYNLTIQHLNHKCFDKNSILCGFNEDMFNKETGKLVKFSKITIRDELIVVLEKIRNKHNTPSEVVREACAQAVSNFNTCITNFNKGYISEFIIKPWKKTRKFKTIKFTTNCFSKKKKNTICQKLLGDYVNSTFPLDKIQGTSTLRYDVDRNMFILYAPVYGKDLEVDKITGVIGIDPGFSTILAGYSNEQITFSGNSIQNNKKIKNYLRKIEIIDSIISGDICGKGKVRVKKDIKIKPIKYNKNLKDPKEKPAKKRKRKSHRSSGKTRKNKKGHVPVPNRIDKVEVNRLIINEDDKIVAETYTYDKEVKVGKFRKLRRKYFKKLANMKDDFHFKETHRIANSCDRVNIGKLSSKQIVDRRNTKIDKVTRQKANFIGHFQFRERFKHICKKYGTQYVEVDEYMTTKTCSNCGKINENLEGSRIFGCSCRPNNPTFRDSNAAKNIAKQGMKAVKFKRACTPNS